MNTVQVIIVVLLLCALLGGAMYNYLQANTAAMWFCIVLLVMGSFGAYRLWSVASVCPADAEVLYTQFKQPVCARRV